MSGLVRGERPFIPPITRRWLQKRGYITVQRVGKGHKLNIEITQLGREVMTQAVKEIRQ